MTNESTITVKTSVNAPAERVWTLWSEPDHITKWAAASDDWHTTRAENDLRKGGKFTSRMEAKDGSFGFDFGGVYDEVRENEYIEYTLGDGRRVTVTFTADGDKTAVVQTFDPETENPREMQQAGWQAILDNFKKYAEAQ
jgi:uncharacterized protein YndB with AHSA1/START domain